MLGLIRLIQLFFPEGLVFLVVLELVHLILQEEIQGVVEEDCLDGIVWSERNTMMGME